MQRGEQAIDIGFLPDWCSFRTRNLQKTIGNVFLFTSFNFQAIAYDPDQRKIIGNIGLQALRTRTVTVNHLEEAKINARLKGKSINQLIKEKSKQFGFKPEYI